MYKYLFIFLILSAAACKSGVESSAIVEVVETDNGYQLYRHGAPYYIKGASGHAFMDRIAAYGGNSIRTWTTEDAGAILDEAEKNGLTVTLGLEIGKEWWGEDFNYWDFKQVDLKIEELKRTVTIYKDHPALLMWGVGNEVQLWGGNRLIVYYTINRIAKMIKEVDPNHPTMTAIALGPNFKYYGILHFLIPNIDILAINAFDLLPTMFSKGYLLAWKKAMMLTEYGPTGPWESQDTEWGAPIEKSSIEKAKILSDQYDLLIKNRDICLGGYAFYWGHKYEGTKTFFSLFDEDGRESESVKILQSKWSGKLTTDNDVMIKSIVIKSDMPTENIYLSSGRTYEASVTLQNLNLHQVGWELWPEGRQDYNPAWNNHNMEYLIVKNNGSTIEFRTPKEEGGYRLFAFLYDEMGNYYSQNIPFYVLAE